MHQDLQEVKRTLSTKPKNTRRKLVGVGVFSLNDLKRLKEEKGKASIKRIGRNKRSRAIEPAVSRYEESTDNGSVTDGVEDCIVVKIPGR